MPKLVLINPGQGNYRLARQGFKVQPLNLAYLAAVTPREWDVVLCDENMREADVQPDASLVGITTLTSTINRAYELASLYRQRGVPVVLGGIHASMQPDEAASFADSVVIGEGESVWPEVLADAAGGRLRPRYEGQHATFDKSVHPRRDLLSDQYTIASLQTSRGCPFDCEFCSVRAFNGGKFRQRAVDDVLAEIAAIPQRIVFFADDNLIGYSRESLERAKAIFRGMLERRMNKKWFCQTSINFADDEELLALAASSGCLLILVGIESISEEALQGSMNKRLNSRKGSRYYYEFLDKIHRHGIMALGTMIFGNDEEADDIFERTTEFYARSGLDIPWPGFLTPYPGTRLFERLEGEDRLLYTGFPRDWSKYNSTIVIRPGRKSAAELHREFTDFTRRNFGLKQVLGRTLNVLRYSRSPARALIAYNFNRSLSRRFAKGLTLPEER